MFAALLHAGDERTELRYLLAAAGRRGADPIPLEERRGPRRMSARTA